VAGLPRISWVPLRVCRGLAAGSANAPRWLAVAMVELVFGQCAVLTDLDK
jgi:hypothetical protein